MQNLEHKLNEATAKTLRKTQGILVNDMDKPNEAIKGKGERQPRRIFSPGTAYFGKHMMQLNGKGQAPQYFSLANFYRMNPLDLTPRPALITLYFMSQRGLFSEGFKYRGKQKVGTLRAYYEAFRQMGVRHADEIKADIAEAATGSFPEWIKRKLRGALSDAAEGLNYSREDISACLACAIAKCRSLPSEEICKEADNIAKSIIKAVEGRPIGQTPILAAAKLENKYMNGK